METETKIGCARSKKAAPTPPPPPPIPFWAARINTDSVTNQEIAKYWRKKQVEEEDHLLAAIKAAARVRARNFTTMGLPENFFLEMMLELCVFHILKEGLRGLVDEDDDYRSFEESLTEGDESSKNNPLAKNLSTNDEINNEIRMGIKDWWTKSKYAYLNQPAIETTYSTKRRRSRSSTYIPSSCSYKLITPSTASFKLSIYIS